MGILFSLLALFSWGVGDFLIQRSARKFGDWVALFYITAFGSIALLPFVYKDLNFLFIGYRGLWVLLAASAVMTFAAYFDFEALRVGKISVIEPIYAFEIVITALLASMFVREYLSTLQMVLVLTIMAGIFLVSASSLHHFKNIKWEKGVILGILATVAMGACNFLFGVGSRDTNPLLVNWFTSLFIALVCLGFLLAKKKAHFIISDLKDNTKLIASVSFVDNLAWVAYCYATLYMPIAIATSITESYIALAALLGFRYNREKLRRHQVLGLILTIAAAVALSAITKG